MIHEDFLSLKVEDDKDICSLESFFCNLMGGDFLFDHIKPDSLPFNFFSQLIGPSVSSSQDFPESPKHDILHANESKREKLNLSKSTTDEQIL